MKCPKMEEIIRFLDEELTLNRMAELNIHFAECPHCAQYRDKLRQLLQSLNMLSIELGQQQSNNYSTIT